MMINYLFIHMIYDLVSIYPEVSRPVKRHHFRGLRFSDPLVLLHGSLLAQVEQALVSVPTSNAMSLGSEKPHRWVL